MTTSFDPIAPIHKPPHLQPQATRHFLQVRNETNGSEIVGEATNKGFTRGARRTVVLVDEFAHIHPTLQQQIWLAKETVAASFWAPSTPNGRGDKFFDLAENMPCIEADASQIRQVAVNLITNASEAIGDRDGAITVSTGVMHCDRDYLSAICLDEGMAEGLYAYMEVSDTGCGMDSETEARIFEPFYTTKFMGRGLGMSAVLGIVRGHSGAIRVESKVGKGTTIRVLFPVMK